ncbi:MAG: hypothetical protein GC204_01015 [Chloroflexi bacterium]|nr:hypothetical protein [Chloroflexota bacterium]
MGSLAHLSATSHTNDALPDAARAPRHATGSSMKGTTDVMREALPEGKSVRIHKPGATSRSPLCRIFS